MGAAAVAVSAQSCTDPPEPQEEIKVRPPWALAQVDLFESQECPFCALRRSHCSWLREEIKRLTGEVSSLQTTIPSKFLPELERCLEELPLPETAYTGGVDDVRGAGCSRCGETREEVTGLRAEARVLDAQCKARIEFRRRFARRIEAVLIEKRRVEAELFVRSAARPAGGHAECGGADLCAITRVNQPDDDVVAWRPRHAGGDGYISRVVV